MKPLVISRQYLWEKNAVGQIQRVFWQYLCSQGVTPTIICQKLSNNRKTTVDEGKCNIITTYNSSIVEYVFAFLKRVIADDIGYMPDSSFFSWAKLSAIKRAKRELASRKYDYIYSVCRSYSNHLIALEAKKQSGLPWVAAFYDPWYDNPYRKFKYRIFEEKDRLYEEKIAINADVILHTNKAIFEEWVERYGESIKEKMYILPLVFNIDEESSYPNNHKSNKTKFVVSHIGTLFKDRDSEDFLKALHLVFEKYPYLKNRMELNYIGTVTDIDRQRVLEYDLSSITNFIGYLSEKECYPYFENTDLFLAIDGKKSRNIFFPSKIMKYFYYGKPILGLTPPQSALQYELNSSGNFCFNNEDIQSISNFIYRALTEEGFLSGNDTTYWKNFTMESIYPKYEEIISNLINKNEYNSK